MSGRFARGVFTLSFDFELVWGARDLDGPLAKLLAEARVTRERVFDPLLATLSEVGIAATWATVGHLMLERARPSVDGAPAGLVPPRHSWRDRPWFEGVPPGPEDRDPEYYARSLVRRLVEAGQEVGAHGFSHAIFGDPGCSRQTADTELAFCVAAAAELGIGLRSFVFPRNAEGHVDLLVRHGFTCYRAEPPHWSRRPCVPQAVGRIAHLCQVLASAPPPAVMPARHPAGIWRIPASSVFFPARGARRHLPVERRVTRALRGLRRAVAEGRVFHLYSHPEDFAAAPAPMIAGLREVLQAVARMRDRGEIDVRTMAELSVQAERETGR